MNEVLVHVGPKFKFLDQTNYGGCADYKEFFTDILTMSLEDNYWAEDMTDDNFTISQTKHIPSIHWLVKNGMDKFPKLYVENSLLTGSTEIEFYESEEDFEESIFYTIDYNGGYPFNESEEHYWEDILMGFNALNVCYYMDTYKNILNPIKLPKEYRVTKIMNSPLKGVW